MSGQVWLKTIKLWLKRKTAEKEVEEEEEASTVKTTILPSPSAPPSSPSDHIIIVPMSAP